MLTIPRALYSHEITTYIKDVILYDNARDFDSLDSMHKDKLSALAMKALGYDTDVVLSNESVKYLSNYLLSHDKDDYSDFFHSISKDSHSQFSDYFNQIISDKLDEEGIDKLTENGFKPFKDSSNGEITWRRSA